jgi:hypothetical protein
MARMATRWWVFLVSGAALIGACGGSKGGGNDGGVDHAAADVPLTESDAGTDATDDVRVSFDVGVDVGTADAATDVRDAGASSDGRDARRYADPVDGAAGCPDGGFAGTAPCDIEMPLFGGLNYNYGASGAGCTYPQWTRLWFTSNGVEVHIDLAAPIVPGAVGDALAASVSINTNPTDFVDKQKIWSTPGGACTITLHGNVCWYYAEQRYQIISGRGTCGAAAVAAKPDGGAPVTIGDFWFSELLNPM